MDKWHGGSGQLNGSKDRCEVNHVSLREHGKHFLPHIPIQLTRNPLGFQARGPDISLNLVERQETRQQTNWRREQQQKEYPSPNQHRYLFKRNLLNIALQQWEAQSDNGDKGRNLDCIIPKVKTTSETWQRPEILFSTGHRPFPSYFYNLR
ncbi:hypothetical protein AVEN_258744-1 [Araneus ventricosus]|uniref:Uncharacterized protein n=1 Tax=Araneus ventricosus TaxID=182803 RepID=A0A4Y2D1C3_ARAVE|nr:hypothetical protein AVEN_258744-1 [Araneus ventricosus]